MFVFRLRQHVGWFAEASKLLRGSGRRYGYVDLFEIKRRFSDFYIAPVR